MTAAPLPIGRQPSLIVRPFIFAREEWKREGGHVFPGTPGSWCDVRPWGADRPRGVLALYRCPACLEIKALHKRVHRIDANGNITPDLLCMPRQEEKGPGVIIPRPSAPPKACSFHRKAYLDRWSNKPLYAIAIERRKGVAWIGEMHYTHASTAEEARFHAGHMGGEYRIVAVAPALGYFVEDKQGNELSLD